MKALEEFKKCPFAKYPFLIGCDWVKCNKCKGKGCKRRDK